MGKWKRAGRGVRVQLQEQVGGENVPLKGGGGRKGGEGEAHRAGDKEEGREKR